uniref:Uncharacterized protein n=1 Tax=Hordeum vulgare subsp. vulgare TaxID=112509 RepID=A0A8I6Y1X1_HORVV
MLNSSQQPLHDYTHQCQLDAIGQAMYMKTQFNMSRGNFNSMMTSWAALSLKVTNCLKASMKRRKPYVHLRCRMSRYMLAQTDVAYLRKSMQATSTVPSVAPVGISRESSVMVRRSIPNSLQMFFGIFQSSQ